MRNDSNAVEIISAFKCSLKSTIKKSLFLQKYYSFLLISAKKDRYQRWLVQLSLKEHYLFLILNIFFVRLFLSLPFLNVYVCVMQSNGISNGKFTMLLHFFMMLLILYFCKNVSIMCLRCTAPTFPPAPNTTKL